MSAAAYILHRAPTFHLGRRHFGVFSSWRAGTTSGASTADTRPYKLSGFVNRSHLRTGWWRDNTFRERSSAVLRRRTEWRVCRAQIVRRLDAYISGRLPQLQAAYISAIILFNVLYYETQTCLTGRQHFMQAHIFVDFFQNILYKCSYFLNLE